MANRTDLLQNRVRRLTRLLRRVDTADMNALHRARIASRRLRELLPILQVPAERVRKLRRRLRRVTGRLGSVRELDVVLLLIEELKESRRQHRAALARIGVMVASRREEARKRLVDRLPVGDLRKIARKIDQVEELLVADAPADVLRARRWAIEARIARRAARLQDTAQHAGSVYLPDRLHDVRVALKKLRYALELAADLEVEKPAPELRALKHVQDVLGRMHDLQVLMAWVRKAQAAGTAPSVPRWRELDALNMSLEDECRRLHAQYMRAQPRIAAMTQKLIARHRGAGEALQAARRAG